MKRFLAVVILAGLMAGCSSQSQSQPNLAQDQATVNRLSAAVAADEYKLSSSNPNRPNCYYENGTPCPSLQTWLNNANHQLASDKFALQVAQDKLKKDEG